MRETCELSLDLLEWREAEGPAKPLEKGSQLWINTNDPAPPFPLPQKEGGGGGMLETEEWSVARLRKLMLDPSERLFTRYRALFTLREIGSKQAAEALCCVFAPEQASSCSPLLKHEVAFVMGQMEGWGAVFTPILEMVIASETG